MRTYSSGMYSRLAFSVAVHMDPDILLIDEALSAGDAKFKKKAADKMRELCTRRARCSSSATRWAASRRCATTAIWLHKGELMLQGSPDEVVAAYTKFLEVGEDAFTLEDL